MKFIKLIGLLYFMHIFWGCAMFQSSFDRNTENLTRIIRLGEIEKMPREINSNMTQKLNVYPFGRHISDPDFFVSEPDFDVRALYIASVKFKSQSTLRLLNEKFPFSKYFPRNLGCSGTDSMRNFVESALKSGSDGVIFSTCRIAGGCFRLSYESYCHDHSTFGEVFHKLPLETYQSILQSEMSSSNNSAILRDAWGYSLSPSRIEALIESMIRIPSDSGRFSFGSNDLNATLQRDIRARVAQLQKQHDSLTEFKVDSIFDEKKLSRDMDALKISILTRENYLGKDFNRDDFKIQESLINRAIAFKIAGDTSAPVKLIIDILGNPSSTTYDFRGSIGNRTTGMKVSGRISLSVEHNEFVVDSFMFEIPVLKRIRTGDKNSEVNSYIKFGLQEGLDLPFIKSLTLLYRNTILSRMLANDPSKGVFNMIERTHDSVACSELLNHKIEISSIFQTLRLCKRVDAVDTILDAIIRTPTEKNNGYFALNSLKPDWKCSDAVVKKMPLILGDRRIDKSLLSDMCPDWKSLPPVKHKIESDLSALGDVVDRGKYTFGLDDLLTRLNALESDSAIFLMIKLLNNCETIQGVPYQATLRKKTIVIPHLISISKSLLEHKSCKDISETSRNYLIKSILGALDNYDENCDIERFMVSLEKCESKSVRELAIEHNAIRKANKKTYICR